MEVSGVGGEWFLCIALRIINNSLANAVLIIWSVIVVPFRLGFNQEAEGIMMAIDIFGDIMFGVDIILCFRVAFLDDHMVYVTEPTLITKNYLCGWFLIDFASTFPTDRLIGALASNSDGVVDSNVDMEEDKYYNASFHNATWGVDPLVDSAAAEQARSLKMIKVLRLIRLSKLARLFKLKGLVKGE